jgi:hypothetical protein
VVEHTRQPAVDRKAGEPTAAVTGRAQPPHVARLIALQRLVGNRAVVQHLQSLAPGTGAGALQRVKGGIEYTEDTPTTLRAYNTKPFPNNVLEYRNFSVGPAPMTAFRLQTGQDPANPDLGHWTNEDLDVLRGTAQVRLTNDVYSAEWIIERHREDLPADEFRETIKEDVNHMFTARAELADAVRSAKGGHAGELGIAHGTKADTNDAPAVFIYSPGAMKGKAQLTAKYTKADSIRRINKLNASKYLTGTKVAEGEDPARVAGTESPALLAADVAGTTSFSTAEVLLTALIGSSAGIPRTMGGAPRLTAAQVGLVKLMVINDALANAMVRYQDAVGQGQEKNIQRFFPKSRRDEYVKTIAQADLDATEMTALRAAIHATSAADAQLVFNSADPAALRTDEAFTELGLGDPTVAGMQIAKLQLTDPTRGTPSAADLLSIKTAVLGANGAYLGRWIDFVALAYTELTAATGDQHYFHDATKPDTKQSQSDIAAYGVGGGGDVTNVMVTSRGFTPLAAGDRGAIYEFREREIPINKSGWITIGSLTALHDAIDLIYGAVE